MPVRYSVTDSSGWTHTRTSRGHTAPRYTHAVVTQPGAGKAGVAYCGSLDLAHKQLNAAMKPLVGNSWTRKTCPERIGKPMHPEAKIYPVTAEIL
jgi:hypothetical protein